MILAAALSFFAQVGELQIQDIATMPILIWFFGVLIWFFAALGRRQGKGGRWKWFLAYALVLVAAYAGWAGWGGDPDRHPGFGPYLLNDFGVRVQYDTKKLVAAVCGSFILPVVSLLLMWFFDRRESRHMADLVR